MQQDSKEQEVVDPAARDFYRRTLEILSTAGIPMLVGGAFAFGHYTGIFRHTKDFDLFVRPDSCPRALEALAAAGYATELTSPVWIGKAFSDEWFVDLIFGGGNGIARVDDEWFAHAPSGTILDLPVRFCPPEEILWSKAFVQDRARYDGADIAHLLRACAAGMDWPRVLRRFGPRWRVLLSHLILFGFIYPAEQGQIPAAVLQELLERLATETSAPAGPAVCRGPLLSRTQYRIDTEQWGYADGRVAPWGNLTAAEVAELNADAPPEHY